MRAKRSAVFFRTVVVLGVAAPFFATPAAEQTSAAAAVTQTPAFKACMQRLAKTVAAADLTDPDHAEHVRIAVNVCSHGAAGQPAPATVEQIEHACASYGYSKETCHLMVAAKINRRRYSGPDAFIPPDDSARGPAFRRCMHSASANMPAPSPWQEKSNYTLLAQGCIEGAAGIPSLDTIAYCRHQGDAAGGSNVVELQCRSAEENARDWIDTHITTQRTLSYCKAHADIADTDDAMPEGSYNKLKSCIEQEEQADRQLRPGN